MANHKSAEKRHRQTVERTVRARAVKSRVRGALKAARGAIAEGSSDAASLVQRASVLLDRAASKNVLPSKRVSRLKSRLAIALQGAGKG
jgi:small subunit ribosomal protein S20